MDSSFGEYFGRLLSRRGVSQNAFSKEVGTSSSFVNSIIKGKRTPPMDRIRDWGEALGLAPGSADYEYFLDLAAIAHIPAEWQERVLGTAERLSKIEKFIENLPDAPRRVAEEGEAYGESP